MSFPPFAYDHPEVRPTHVEALAARSHGRSGGHVASEAIRYPPLAPSALVDACLDSNRQGTLTRVEWARLLLLLTAPRDRRARAGLDEARCARAAEVIWRSADRPLVARAANAVLAADLDAPLVRALVVTDRDLDDPRSFASACLHGRWGALAEVARARGKAPHRVAAHLGLVLPRRFEERIFDAAALDAHRDEQRFDRWLTGILRLQGPRRQPTRLAAIRALLKHVPGADAEAYPDIARTVGELFTPDAPDCEALTEPERLELQHWLGDLRNLELLRSIIRAVQDVVHELNPTLLEPTKRHTSKEKLQHEKNRLQGRFDFWSHYRRHVRRVRLFVTDRSERALSHLLRPLPSGAVGRLTSGSQSQSEILLIDLGAWAAVDELRGYGPTSKVALYRTTRAESWFSGDAIRPEQLFPACAPRDWQGDHDKDWAARLRAALHERVLEPTLVDGAMRIQAVMKPSKYEVRRPDDTPQPHRSTVHRRRR